MSVQQRSKANQITQQRSRAILTDQGHQCAYCALPFGSVIVKRGKAQVTSPQFDHFTPFAYLGTSPGSNWLAACRPCNLIKGAQMFRSLSDARLFILAMWEQNGYQVQWVAPVSCSEAPDRWAVKFATYLASLPRGLAQSVTVPARRRSVEVLHRERREAARLNVRWVRLSESLSVEVAS